MVNISSLSYRGAKNTQFQKNAVYVNGQEKIIVVNEISKIQNFNLL